MIRRFPKRESPDYRHVIARQRGQPININTSPRSSHWSFEQATELYCTVSVGRGVMSRIIQDSDDELDDDLDAATHTSIKGVSPKHSNSDASSTG